MNDFSEELPKEQTVVSPELGAKMAEVTTAVKEGMAEPGADVAGTTQQLGMFAELWQVQKEFGAKKLGIMFKDLKAVLGIIPYIPKISEWNTARIASKPIEKLGESAAEAKAAIAAREATLSHGVEEVGAVGNKAVAAQKEVSQKKNEIKKIDRKIKWTERIPWGNKSAKIAKLQVDRTVAEQARDAAINKGLYPKADWAASAQTFDATLKGRMKDLGVTSEAYFNKLPDKARRALLKSLGLSLPDKDMIGRWDEVKKHFEKKSGFTTMTEKMQALGNGDMPARTKAEQFGKNAKFVAKNYILQNLGPIIDPAPDVPGLVRLGSLGAALLGFPEVDLIVPVWQFAHNRYEEVLSSVDASKRSAEIVKRHWDQKFGKLKEPGVQKAAEAFLPTPQKAAA